MILNSGYYIQENKNCHKIFKFPNPMNFTTKRSGSMGRNQKRQAACKHTAQKNPVQVGSDDKSREFLTSNFFLFVNSLVFFFLRYTFILVIFVLSDLLKTQKGTRSLKKKIKESIRKWKKREKKKLYFRNRSSYRTFLSTISFRLAQDRVSGHETNRPLPCFTPFPLCSKFSCTLDLMLSSWRL